MRRNPITLLVVLVTALALCATPALAKKKKKKGAEPEAPKVGAVQVGDWTCYAPPNFSKLSATDVKRERQKGYEFVSKLVTGKQFEDFKIDDEDMEFFETAFLGRPQLLDEWLAENFQWCSDVGNGKKKKSAYFDYLSKIGREFEANECYKPLIYEVHDFLDIQSGWQWRYHMCKGDAILVESTGLENGKYTVQDTENYKLNKYITASGDPDVLQAGDAGLVPESPLGALVMRFEAEDGSYTKYVTVGHHLEFRAPDHGYISFAINDTTYFDNKFHDIKGAIDYLGVDIYPPVSDGGGVEGGVVP